ncbi:MAG: hypothetical protein R3Y60_06060 [bacterium]
MNYTKEELEFIKYFGVEKLEELEIQDKLNIFIKYICKNYLGNIEPIFAVFDHTIKSTALYHFDLNAIILHPKNKNDMTRLKISILHELEHYFQWVYVNNFNTNKAKRWTKEIENYNTNKKHYYNQEIEIDAIAFSQVVMYEEYKLKVEVKDNKLQNKINKYKLIMNDYK